MSVKLTIYFQIMLYKTDWYYTALISYHHHFLSPCLVINKPDIPLTKRMNLEVGSKMIQQVNDPSHPVAKNARSLGVDSAQPGSPLLKGRKISAQM